MTRPCSTVLDVRVVTGTGGGPDKTILNSPRFLTRDGYRMLCAYLHPPGDPGFEHIRRRAEEAGAPLVAIADRGPWDWRVAAELLDLCRRERVAIWHGHDYKSNALGLLLRRFWPMRLVTTLHGWVHHTRRTPAYYWLDRWCLKRYELVLSVSPDLREQGLLAGAAPSRSVLLENGIDTEQFRRRQSAAQARDRLGIAPGRFLVGAVGRLSPEKGFDLLIRAADQLLAEGLDLELAVVGEGPEQGALERLIAELGRGGRVRLLGFQADPQTFYEALDLLVLSSHREGLPNVLLEAMALETPVAATRVNGVPRLVRDGENGLLVEAGSHQALAAAMSRLLQSPDLCRRFAQAGRRTVEHEFSFARRMERLAALYDDLLGRTHRRESTERHQQESMDHDGPHGSRKSALLAAV